MSLDGTLATGDDNNMAFGIFAFLPNKIPCSKKKD
jgi:hypothetical protein